MQFLGALATQHYEVGEWCISRCHQSDYIVVLALALFLEGQVPLLHLNILGQS